MSAEEMHAAVMTRIAERDDICRRGGGCGLCAGECGGRKDKEGRPRHDDARTEKDAGHSRRRFAKNRTNGLLVVGFAAETNDVVGYARSKMEKKNLDMVVANDITKEGAGFNTDTNIATILTRGGEESNCR